MHDGFVLEASIVRSPLGGQLLDECLAASLIAKGYEPQPWYMVSRARKPSAAGGGAGNISKSHVAWATAAVVADVKESMCRVSESPFVEEDNVNMPMQTYQLPDGSTVDVGPDRFKVPEALFAPVRSDVQIFPVLTAQSCASL